MTKHAKHSLMAIKHDTIIQIFKTIIGIYNDYYSHARSDGIKEWVNLRTCIFNIWQQMKIYFYLHLGCLYVYWRMLKDQLINKLKIRNDYESE